jgi:hypothetical protein
MGIPQEIIEQDHKLETAADRASGKLAEHRWHQTKDPNGPGHSFTDYARAVGRSVKAISAMVNGFVVQLQTGGDLQEIIQLQGVKEADRQVTEAVAKAAKVSVHTARTRHRDDVDKVRNAVAEARAEEPDFTPDREQEIIDRSATLIAAERKARKASQQQRRKSQPLQVLVVEGDLASARIALEKAKDDVRLLDLGEAEEEVAEALRATIARIVALAQLVQTALGGQVEVDWDAELAKIGG